eukprot:2682710-Pyramimonas_sp.AAC.1
MSPARPRRAVGPSECSGASPAGCWWPQHTVESQMEPQPCSRARTKQVAAEALATVASEHAAGRWHAARQWA